MMLKKSLLAVSLAVAALGAQAQSLTDGSFEASGTGWTLTGSGSGVFRSPVSQDGQMFSFINGGSASQTVSLLAGTEYVLSFWAAAASLEDVAFFEVTGLDSGGSFSIGSGFLEPTASMLELGWTQFTYNFVATGGATDISFVNTAGAPMALDNVSLTTAVPEPESYAMLLAGLGAVGFISRRRKQQQA